MSRRVLSSITPVGAVAVVVLMVAAIVAGIALTSDDPQPLEDSPGRLYDVLRSAAFSPDDVPASLSFEYVGGTLPRDRADEEKLWLVYATFDGAADRAITAFQVFSSPAAAAEFVSTQFDDFCVRDEVSWSCADSYGPIVVKGETKCIHRRCRPSRRVAEALLAAGRRHLDRLDVITAPT